MAAKDEQVISLLGVISEGARFKILSVIASKGEITAKDILEQFDFTQPTLSHHMACLTEAGLVNVRRKGRFAYYSFNKETLDIVSSGIESLKEPSGVYVTEKKTKRKVSSSEESLAEKTKKGKKKKKKDKSKKKKKD